MPSRLCLPSEWVAIRARPAGNVAVGQAAPRRREVPPRGRAWPAATGLLEKPSRQDQFDRRGGENSGSKMAGRQSPWRRRTWGFRTARLVAAIGRQELATLHRHIPVQRLFRSPRTLPGPEGVAAVPGAEAAAEAGLAAVPGRVKEGRQVRVVAVEGHARQSQ